MPTTHNIPAGESRLVDLDLRNCLELRAMQIPVGVLTFTFPHDGTQMRYIVTKPGRLDEAIVCFETQPV